MKQFLIKWGVNTAALVIVVWLVPGISSANWESLISASLVLGLLNTFIRPLINVLTLPLQVFTLGIFTLLINGFLFFLLARLVDGFFIAGYGSAFWGAVLFSIISFILNLFFLPRGNVQFYYQGHQEQSHANDKNVIDVKAVVKDEKDKE